MALIPIRRVYDSRRGFPNQKIDDSTWQVEGLPWASRLRFERILQRLRCAGWRGGRGTAIRSGGFWRSLRCLTAPRAEAAKIGGMDRQTLRDWVIRFNEQGPDGLINVPAPGAPAKLNAEHRAFLAQIVDEGPIPAIHGVVRWRACDLIMRVAFEGRVSRSRTTS